MKMFLKDNKRTIITAFRYTFLLATVLLIFKLLIDNRIEFKDYQNTLMTLLSTIGITVAIIISFFFSKLFSERIERIERKRLIDIDSQKITALRKICHFIRSENSFWQPFDNLKSKLDNEYKNLKLEDYDSTKINYDTYSKFIEEVNFGELGGQAYVGIRQIEGKEHSSIVFHDAQFKKNYSIEEIRLIQDASGRIWSFLDKHKDQLIDINNMGCYSEIDRNMQIIYSDNNFHVDNEKLIYTFDYFCEIITKRIFNLTQKNYSNMDMSFNLLFIDLLFCVVLLLSGVLVLSINYSLSDKISHIQLIISFFVVVVIDLVINIMSAKKRVLQVDDFYEV